MATASTLRSDLGTAVDLIAGSRITGSDYSRRVALPSGTNDFQIRVDAVGLDREDANTAYALAQAEVTVARDVGATEADAEVQSMLSLQATLTSHAFWRALSASVFEVTQGPEVVDTIERVGNVLAFTVRCEVRLKP